MEADTFVCFLTIHFQAEIKYSEPTPYSGRVANSSFYLQRVTSFKAPFYLSCIISHLYCCALHNSWKGCLQASTILYFAAPDVLICPRVSSTDHSPDSGSTVACVRTPRKTTGPCSDLLPQVGTIQSASQATLNVNIAVDQHDTPTKMTITWAHLFENGGRTM